MKQILFEEIIPEMMMDHPAKAEIQSKLASGMIASNPTSVGSPEPVDELDAADQQEEFDTDFAKSNQRQDEPNSM